MLSLLGSWWLPSRPVRSFSTEAAYDLALNKAAYFVEATTTGARSYALRRRNAG